MSAVGEDDDADFIRAKLKEFGVEPCFTTGFLPTGLAVAKSDENGKMTYDIVYPSAWDRMGIPSYLTDLYVGVGAICFGTLAGRNPGNGALITALVKLARKEGVGLRVFDVNLRPPHYSEEYIKGLMPLCSVLKLSDEEYPEIRKIYDLDADALKGCNQLLEKFNLDCRRKMGLQHKPVRYLAVGFLRTDFQPQVGGKGNQTADGGHGAGLQGFAHSTGG